VLLLSQTIHHAPTRPSRPPCLWGRVGALGPVPALRGLRASGGGSARWGLCPPDPIRPGGRAGPGRWTGRSCRASQDVLTDFQQGRPLPHPPRRDEDRCSPPDVSRRGRASRRRVSRRRCPPLIGRRCPPFREGEHPSASNGICHYKSVSGPRACRWATQTGDPTTCRRPQGPG
jgi:hypothetical protein